MTQVGVLGTEMEKIVEGARRKIIPLIAAEVDIQIPQMGIGYFCPGKKDSHFGGVAPFSLIRCWRGMKILEQLDEVEPGDLSACWELGAKAKNLCIPDESRERCFNELAKKCGGEKNLNEMLQKIYLATPASDDLQVMINKIRPELLKRGWDLDGHELKEEIAAGHIECTPEIEDIIGKKGWIEPEYIEPEIERREGGIISKITSLFR